MEWNGAAIGNDHVSPVRFLGTASGARDADIAGLLDELNQTRTIYDMPDNLPKLGPEASN